ncbi:MAG: hypothetical protein WCK58_17720 [Chloroflexota bacterium]
MTDARHQDAAADAARELLKDGLWSTGMPEADAEAWIARWVAEAAGEGIDPRDPRYWALARDWIDRSSEAS